MAIKETDLEQFMSDWKGPRCTAGMAIEKLDDERRELIKAAILHERAVSVKIAQKLSEWSQIRVSENTMARHRRGACACQGAE